MSPNQFVSSNPFYSNEQEINKIRNFHHCGDDDKKAYDYDEEEEEEEEEAEEEEEEDALLLSNMSLSLMKALGMDTTGVEEVMTDWRPPSQSGLQHSERKIGYCLYMLLIVFVVTSIYRFYCFTAIVRSGSRCSNDIDVVPTYACVNRASTFILP